MITFEEQEGIGVTLDDVKQWDENYTKYGEKYNPPPERARDYKKEQLPWVNIEDMVIRRLRFFGGRAVIKRDVDNFTASAQAIMDMNTPSLAINHSCSINHHSFYKTSVHITTVLKGCINF